MRALNNSRCFCSSRSLRVVIDWRVWGSILLELDIVSEGTIADLVLCKYFTLAAIGRKNIKELDDFISGVLKIVTSICEAEGEIIRDTARI